MPRTSRTKKVEAAPSTTPSTATRGRPAHRSALVANSSDNEQDIATDDRSLLQTTKITRSSSRRIFDGVIIPPTAPDSKDVVQRAVSGSTTTSLSSAGLSTRDSSISFETPNTTAANTPAEGSSFGRNLSATMKVGNMAFNASNKRKRSTKASRSLANTQNDEDIARQLQEEEYGEESLVDTSFEKSQSSRKRSRIYATDSEDDSIGSLSDVKSESEEEPLITRSRHFKGSNRSAQFGDPPSSSARKAARSASTRIKKIDFIDDSTSAKDSDFDPAEDEPLIDRRDSVSTLTSLDSGVNTPSNLEALQGTVKSSAYQARKEARRQQRMENLRRRRARGGGPYDRKAARRSKLETAHPEIKTMWEDLEKIPKIVPVAAQQPESISRTLKSFQLEGLDWMIRQEKSTYKGGLLGDEMGMGKTIQAVSLIMSDFPVKAPSLVLVPPVALMQWANEISEYTNGKLKVLIVHNTNAKSKNLSTKVIRAHNVVIMSYNSLESMYRKQEKGWTRGEDIIKEASPIHAVKFHRLILDEAHSIKQRNTGVAKACFALKGTYKWCLSGTPVQNRIGEFFSLLRFLEVRPFADYFCERCSCAQLHWSVGEDYMCTHCKHSAAEHRSVFNEELLNPITGDSMTLRSEAMDKLHMITSRVMLRRMKKDHTSSMELPPKEVVIHNEFFGEIERDFSSSIMTNSTRKFDTYVAQGVMLNNYANIFGLIMQMRQVANHPDLITRKNVEGGQNILICCICDEPAEEPVKSKCQGKKCSFCRSCVKDFVRTCEASGTAADCPRCHVPLEIEFDQPDIVQDEDAVKKSSIINRIKMEDWTSSTKIEMLVYDLYKLRSKKQTLKSIVFSQFTSMLQLIEWRLRRAGFNTVMLDGSMTPVQRQRSIEYFMNNADVEVFLVSLKAGGVALNLTEASRVFIVDPWWNPAAEWQSADRCHRIGQTRPCVITRLVIEDSVESRMVMLQEKKASMISGTINNDKVAMDKLSPEDLQFLFRGT